MNKAKTALFLQTAIQDYIDARVGRAAAALSYFLMLSIFPLLICLYAMLGSLFPTQEAVYSLLSSILPSASVETIMDYLVYISQNQSTTMLAFAIVAMATTSAAAFRVIDSVMGDMRGRKRFQGFLALVFSFIFSLLFLAAVYLAVIIMLTGSWLMEFLSSHFLIFQNAESWNWFRFILLFMILFVIIMGVYKITAPSGGNIRTVPGAIIATVALVGVSILFSFFISMSIKYPLIYGSLASVMILMFWLYVCGLVLISGNIINVALEKCAAKAA